MSNTDAEQTTSRTNRYGIGAALPSLLALAAGIVVGSIAHQTNQPLLLAAESWLFPVGQVWIAALQMTVLPLVVANLITAILANAEAHIFGRLGIGALGLFVAFLILGAVFGVISGTAIISLIPVTPETVAGFSSIAGTAEALASNTTAFPEPAAWLVSLIPVNPFGALAEGHLLPILLFTIAFSVATTRIPDDGRRAILQFFLAVSQAMMVLVHWILRATPLGVFALTLSFASTVGAEVGTAIVQYLVLICAHLGAFTALLYPLTLVAAGVPLRTFARAVLPAQVVAVGTRSSLASLPALLDGSKGLTLKPSVAEISLPLAVALFKSNRTVSSTIKLLFIAHLFGIDLSAAQILVFVATIIIVSFSAVGIPLGGGGLKSLPAYLAAGIPVEAYILFKAVEAVPDIFKTLLNVTADMSVAAILNRLIPAHIATADEPLAAGQPERLGPG